MSQKVRSSRVAALKRRAVARKRKPTPLPKEKVALRMKPSGRHYLLRRPTPDEAHRWAYVVRNRRRWSDPYGLIAIARRARKMMETLGASSECLETLATSRVCEVTIGRDVLTPARPPGTARRSPAKAQPDERVFPWEYVLSAASLHRERPLSVVRYVALSDPKAPEKQHLETPTILLFVQCAPGDLAPRVWFEAERELIESSFPGQVSRIVNPTLDELRQRIRELRPRAIHISGIDSHQGAKILGRSGPVPDGVYMRAAGGASVVDATHLAAAVVSPRTPPSLVTCNFYNSAPRAAAQMLARGAGAAIGFQDAFDDAQGELFWGNFYAEWRKDFDTTRAFGDSLNGLQLDRIRGTGIVLWTSSSIRDHKGKAHGTNRTVPSLLDDHISVDVQVRPEINYSLLHNAENIFRRFRIHRTEPAAGPTTADVDVELHLGEVQFAYRTSVALDKRVVDLSSRIHVPLTSDLRLTLQEHTRSSIYVSVRIFKRVLYRDTHQVTLLPSDQWRFEGANWLPSFVLPRDPAVSRIVASGQRYVQALRDDTKAGFDGYQAIEARKSAYGPVDRQVQALWWAVTADLPVTYINPPPSFTRTAQRLRTPSEVVDSKRGTCIDLALMLAACLEYIGLDPVIFLLRGHAFAGYWRTPNFQQRFQHMGNVLDGLTPVDGSEYVLGDPGGEPNWYFPRTSFNEIKVEVEEDRLVPVETVGLTRHHSLVEAQRDARNTLLKGEEFECMVDIARARAAGVTPLPLARAAR